MENKFDTILVSLFAITVKLEGVMDERIICSFVLNIFNILFEAYEQKMLFGMHLKRFFVFRYAPFC